MLSRRNSRLRSVWSDPLRKLRTLESFAATEEDGGKDLEVAARRVLDPELRDHLLRHAADERRHAALFRARADELRPKVAQEKQAAAPASASEDLIRGRKDETDAHGFFKAGLIDELGDVAYVAMLNVAERKAARTFAMHRDLVGDDAELKATFESILKDEKYHVAYTQRFLEAWEAAGRGGEVRRGLRSAKSSRLMGAWRRLGQRSGARFSQFVLWVFYWTLLLPFGLLARGQRERPAVRELERARSGESLRSQY